MKLINLMAATWLVVSDYSHQKRNKTDR